MDTAKQNKTLLLHVDINQTIMMTCIGKSNSYVIQSELAADEQYKDKWEAHLPEMTYHKYLTEHKLLPFKGTKELRDKTIQEFENFVPMLESTQHRFFNEVKKRYDLCLEKLNNPKNAKIVPSFYNLLSWLESEKHQYKVLIRTFGGDGDVIAKELKEHANLNLVPARFGYTLCLMSDLPENNLENAVFGKVYIAENGQYVIRDQKGIVQSGIVTDIKVDLTNLSKGLNDLKLKAAIMKSAAEAGFVPKLNADSHFFLNVANGSKVELNTDDLNEIYRCWTETDQHLLIRDNYDRWGQNNQHWMHGKPYPLERSSEKTISIFFDDNIKADKSEKNIVAPFDVNTNQFIDVQTSFEEGNSYPIKPLKAIEDDNYFISLVKATLSNTSELMQNKTFTPMLLASQVITAVQPSENLGNLLQNITEKNIKVEPK